MKIIHSTKQNTVFLSTGSNIGDRNSNLLTASDLIQQTIGDIMAISSVYETAPWGHADQPWFYNQVLQVSAALAAEEVMEKILEIEIKMGRKRTFKNASRIIDIDILFYNDEILDNEKVTIPHPAIASRNFVLFPLNELAPGLLHPLLKKTITELLKESDDKLLVKAVGE